VVHGDGADPKYLKDAGIKRADSVIITTRKDTVNYKIAMAVSTFAVKKVMVRVSDEDAFGMFTDMGFEPFKITPAMSAKLVERLLKPDAVQIHEFILPARCQAHGMKVEELDLPDEVTLVSVLRGDYLEVPEPAMTLKAGDVITAIASEEDILKLRKILGAQLDLNPLQRIYVPYNGEKTTKHALKEAFIIAKHANATVICVYNKRDPSQSRSIKQLEQMFRLQNVDIEIRGVDCDLYTGMRTLLEANDKGLDPAIKRECILFDCIMLDPEKSTFFERLAGNTRIDNIFKEINYPLIITGNMNQYKSILLLIDSSEHSDMQVSLTIDLAILFGSRVHLLIAEDEDDKSIRRLVRYVKRAGRLYGLDVVEQYIEGNPTLEFIENVKSDEFDLVVVNWNCRTIKKDIVRRVVEYGPRSVLIIP